MKVYLAGPDVFLPDAKVLGERKKEICARFGLTGLFPLDGPINGVPDGDGGPVSMQIFRCCTAMMDRADAVIAHLTPFRGPSADAGTVYELGYMAAHGKICTGYSNRRDSYADRIDRVPGVAPESSGLASLDCEGLAIEDFGLTDNLMIAHALETFGHPVLTPETEPADIWRDLTLFEKCVAWIARQPRRVRQPSQAPREPPAILIPSAAIAGIDPAIHLAKDMASRVKPDGGKEGGDG